MASHRVRDWLLLVKEKLKNSLTGKLISAYMRFNGIYSMVHFQNLFLYHQFSLDICLNELIELKSRLD